MELAVDGVRVEECQVVGDAIRIPEAAKQVVLVGVEAGERVKVEIEKVNNQKG